MAQILVNFRIVEEAKGNGKWEDFKKNKPSTRR